MKDLVDMRKRIKIDFSPGYLEMFARLKKLDLIHEEQIVELVECLIEQNNKVLGCESVDKWDADNCISFMKILNPSFSIPENCWWTLKGMKETLDEFVFQNLSSTSKELILSAIAAPL